MNRFKTNMEKFFLKNDQHTETSELFNWFSVKGELD